MLANVYGLRLLRKPNVQRSALVVAAAIALAFRAIQFLSFTDRPQWGYDFAFYWTAGQHLLRGEPIYSLQQLSGPYAPQGQEGFLYPPPFAAVMVPFAALSRDPRAAMWLWAAIGAVVLVASVLALARVEASRLVSRFPILEGRGRWFLVAAAFAMPPVVGELAMGNVHLILLGLFTLAWVGIRRGDGRGEIVAGLAVGVAAVIKVFPGLVLLWFLATRRWRAAMGIVLGALAAVLVTLPVTGIQPWRDFPVVLLNLSAPSDTTDALAPTVWLAPIVGFEGARFLVTAGAIVVVAWAARSRSPAASFGLAVLASVLVAPALYHHYLAILVLPLILGLASGAPLALIAAGYLLTWGGEQAALGEWAWVVLRLLPTLGCVAVGVALIAAPGDSRQWKRPIRPVPPDRPHGSAS